ncbi:YdeI/OmpD-associated family protein [Cohnella rhizosphaerae]|uniref:YdeI/OmpD-associated family protein n=1 Tax=Cohnella rhizosphaerae TaxID=1457232 RepID=A0A9X4KUR8_9BACL|nr:YdeI/OmpD-associated family protein [Cohnella rhizosphaerae]MDG0809304.1 YdeI/OmpD-associated family protein [Cohnella rhizosphaerae]
MWPPRSRELPRHALFFDGLSNSNKSRVVLSVEGAKTEETRLRRIDKAVQALSEGKAI